MKPFKFFLYHNNFQMSPEIAMALFGKKTRAIGITYDKSLMVGRFGTKHILTFWIWKRYLFFKWITGEEKKFNTWQAIKRFIIKWILIPKNRIID